MPRDRWEENDAQPTTPRLPAHVKGYLIFYYVFMALLCVAIFIATIVAYFVLVDAVKTKAEDHPLCAYFAELATQPGVEVAAWIGYPQGWRNYPKEWDYETITDLAGGAVILTRVSEDKRWLWGFRSLKEEEGNHDFCEHVLIVDDSP